MWFIFIILYNTTGISHLQVNLIAFPWQQWLHNSTSCYVCSYNACIVKPLYLSADKARLRPKHQLFSNRHAHCYVEWSTEVFLLSLNAFLFILNEKPYERNLCRQSRTSTSPLCTFYLRPTVNNLSNHQLPRDSYQTAQSTQCLCYKLHDWIIGVQLPARRDIFLPTLGSFVPPIQWFWFRCKSGRNLSVTIQLYLCRMLRKTGARPPKEDKDLQWAVGSNENADQYIPFDT